MAVFRDSPPIYLRCKKGASAVKKSAAESRFRGRLVRRPYIGGSSVLVEVFAHIALDDSALRQRGAGPYDNAVQFTSVENPDRTLIYDAGRRINSAGFGCVKFVDESGWFGGLLPMIVAL